MLASPTPHTACDHCHRKKVKCDLGKNATTQDICSICLAVGQSCIPHKRKRMKQRAAREHRSDLSRSILSSDHTSDSLVAEAQHHASPNFAVVQSHLERSDYLAGNEVPFYERPSNLDGRSNISNLSDEDYRILDVQKAFEYPSRSVRASLIDHFFKYCEPWSPVVEPSWLEEASTSYTNSPLLLNSVFLAGSRVSSVPLLDVSAEDFYRRARLLFMLGHEKNIIFSTIAVCLLQWWNPTSPEQISTNTSGFWARIASGLAYQIGLHKEPNKKDPLGKLRRRLWWTVVCRDNIISVGVGRPRAISFEDCNVIPLTVEDFDNPRSLRAELFVAFAEITQILADVTESIRRKNLSIARRKDLQNALYRWIKQLPSRLRLFNSMWPRKLAEYQFESRQLLVPYFVILIILSKDSRIGKRSISTSLVAASFVTGLFEDFLNRDELRYLGPAFAFYALAAGLAHLSGYMYEASEKETAVALNVFELCLKELSKRWGSAESSLTTLREAKRIMLQKPKGQALRDKLPQHLLLFFEEFGADLCKMWHLMPGEFSNARDMAFDHQSAPRTKINDNSSTPLQLSSQMEALPLSQNNNPTSESNAIAQDWAPNNDPLTVGVSLPSSFLSDQGQSSLTDLDLFEAWILDDLRLETQSFGLI